MNSPSRRRRGFTLVEIMIVVTIVGILSAMAIAGIHKVKAATNRAIVMNNLRQIYQAKEMYISSGEADPRGYTAVDMHDNDYLSDTLWVACYETPGAHGFLYQGASFASGESVWAAPSVIAGNVGTVTGDYIYYPGKEP
jgi:prepilin-type N-terminal cleavage/methylation domain-containing protein